MAKLFFFDVETTGVNAYKNAMHQISGSIVINGEIKEDFDIKLAPREDAVIEEAALKVSNVTEEQIRAYQPPIEAYRQLLKMLGKYCDKYNKTDKLFLVGYNNKGFDNDFMRNFFKQNNDNYFGSWFWADTIDVMVLAANYLMDERHKMENFQLRTVAKYLGIEVDETKLHDAMYDIYLTRAIYEIVRYGKKPDGITVTPPIEVAVIPVAPPRGKLSPEGCVRGVPSAEFIGTPVTEKEKEDAVLREAGLLLEHSEEK